MKHSIAIRLATMFTIAALCVFSMIGFALDRVFERALNRHQTEQLKTTFQVMEYVISNSHSTANWDRVRAKLDDLTPPDESTLFWVWSQDPRIQYGKPLPHIDAINHGKTGIGQLTIDQRPVPMKIQVADFPANGERPALRFMVGIDSTPYLHTERAVEIALAGLSAIGIVLVAMLGYATAWIGLKPLNNLSRDVQGLTPKNLAQRLQVSALPTELSDLGISFNGALDRLESAYQLLEAFNADVAHELRTPLSNLIGQTQVTLSRERTAAELEEILQSNLEEMERMRAIVNDMLFLTRADQGELATRLIASSVADEVNKTVEFLDFLLDEANITVRVQGDAQAYLETSLFRRAITNLLHNAIQHAPAGSEIIVNIAIRQSTVWVTVSNHGAEIPPEHLPRIFDRFYRVDSSRTNSRQSHGLGLSIVKAIATMHQGTVFASSQAGVTMVGFSIGVPANEQVS